jgi:FkbM family methyltransferase
MRSTIQNSLLKSYRLLVSAGVLEIKGFRVFFLTLYLIYKKYFEALSPKTVQKFISKDAIIFDVGANVGFYTIELAKWLDKNGRIIAIEPEERNLSTLRWRIESKNLGEKVFVEDGVASDAVGEVFLQIREDHPGDHFIASEGTITKSVTLDHLALKHRLTRVDFIKIDVQGAESLVLNGCEQIIKKFYPILMIEIDQASLNRHNTNAKTLVTQLGALEYQFKISLGRNLTRDIEAPEIAELANVKNNYFDLICLPKNGIR